MESAKICIECLDEEQRGECRIFDPVDMFCSVPVVEISFNVAVIGRSTVQLRVSDVFSGRISGSYLIVEACDLRIQSDCVVRASIPQLQLEEPFQISLALTVIRSLIDECNLALPLYLGLNSWRSSWVNEVDAEGRCCRRRGVA